jgi:hypothetical protein
MDTGRPGGMTPSSETRPFFLVTIDVEGDNVWARQPSTTTRNASFLPRFQELCERHGLRPTYLTNLDMARAPDFRDFARCFLREDTAELGMHLHAWDNLSGIQLTADDWRHHPYLMEFPEDVIHREVGLMTDLLQDAYGVKVVSHRAGRWGLDAAYARALDAHGYRVDCSVTPHQSWRDQVGDPNGRGGSDYCGFPEHAYWLDLMDIARSGTSGLLEVPMTVRPYHHALVNTLRHCLREGSFFRRLVDWSCPPVVWLRPNGRNLRRMLQLLCAARAEGRDYVMFMLHSSELMPGGSPRFGTEAAVEKLYTEMERIFREAAAHFRGATLDEYRQDFETRSVRPGAFLDDAATVALR